MRSLVTGAGGFIGGHLVKRLLDLGHQVRAVDIKPLEEWWQLHPQAQSTSADLRIARNCKDVVIGQEWVFQLACDMGGIGFIETHKADCMVSVLINTHMLMAATCNVSVKRYFYSSSACVYRADKQNDPDAPALREEDAYPALAEDGYGWEKLFSERMCRHFMEDYNLECRVARFHNVAGPMGSWCDGREKAPAALSRKVAEAKLSGLPAGRQGNHTIDIWGNGARTRSFMWIEDCLDGILKIMESDIRQPVNLGTSEKVSINELADVIEEIAGIKCNRVYDLSKPQGVHGRNSDNTRIKNLLGWEPSTPLRQWMPEVYHWVEEKVRESHQ